MMDLEVSKWKPDSITNQNKKVLSGCLVRLHAHLVIDAHTNKFVSSLLLCFPFTIGEFKAIFGLF